MLSSNSKNFQFHRDKEVITFTNIAFLKLSIITLIAFNFYYVLEAEKVTKIHKWYPFVRCFKPVNTVSGT